MFSSVIRKVIPLLSILLLLAGLITGSFTSARVAHAASSITIDGATKHQTIDGFGASEAFGQANAMKNVTSATAQQQMLDLLFNTSTGAGFSILRNLLPSDANHTIEATAPASPTTTPSYTWDGSSWGQVWLAQQAQSYGVKQIYGDAWSAPGFMKTNGNESNGGTLCGAPGATACSTGDWRQAYANYLVQYIKDYQSAGVTLSHIGIVNEPNLTTTYSSMVMSPSQSADFASILGPTLKSAGLSTQIVCCDMEGWNFAQSYADGITSNPAANSDVSIISSHGYTGAPNSPLTGINGKHVWETEWSTFDGWNPAWDDGSNASGLAWAQNIYTGLTSANLSAFLYWWGVSNGTDNQPLIQLNGTTVNVSKRLWALANYSRFIRPGATRIGATSDSSNLETTAYTNPDGSLSIVVLNTATTDTNASFALQNTGVADGATVVPYITNTTNSTTAQVSLSVMGGAFNTTVPARSLVTYVIPPSSTGGTPQPTATPAPIPSPTPSPTPAPIPSPTPMPSGICTVHYAVNQWSGGFTANVSINNTSTNAINGWTLAFAFPGNQTVQTGWGGIFSQQGNLVTVTNASYNATISPAVNLGFNASWSGSNPSPTSFTLNGTTCSSV